MSAAKERPILFSAPMVRSILAGTKTQTRRVVKHPLLCNLSFIVDCSDGWWGDEKGEGQARCPHGKPGDRLWVRESWAAPHNFDAHRPADIPASTRWHYAATEELGGLRGRPSIHMPRCASRITMEVTGVRVERLQDISEADAVAEGTPCYVCGGPMNGLSEADCHCFHNKAKPSDYRALWESINGPGSWDLNPWVWAVDFKVTP
jgi:hypothetical protein